MMMGMGRPSDTKDRLLTAAIDLIWQRSYGAVSVDDICEAANVKKGSFYHFFKSKSELVVAALDHHWQFQVRPMLDRVFSPSVSPAGRFGLYFKEAYEKQVGFKQKFGRVLGCPLCSIGSETSVADAAICDKVRQLMELYDRYWTSAIRDLLLDRGEPPTRVDEIAGELEAFMNGVMTQARIKNDPELVRQLEAGGMRILGVVASQPSAA
jgi:TetR/AcrR family transcriptional regulator, transcriptional repressor for nem operon